MKLLVAAFTLLLFASCTTRHVSNTNEIKIYKKHALIASVPFPARGGKEFTIINDNVLAIFHFPHPQLTTTGNAMYNDFKMELFERNETGIKGFKITTSFARSSQDLSLGGLEGYEVFASFK